MRKLLLTLVLGLGAVGIIGALPSKANAYWIMTAYGPVNVNAYSSGAYGSMIAYGRPGYSYYVNPWSYGVANYYPASYRYAYSPTSVSAMWATRSMLAYNYNPWYGYVYNVSTPSYYGYTINPYWGYQPYFVPGVSYSVPAYYSGYLPLGYVR